jgi:hypothetical protein
MFHDEILNMIGADRPPERSSARRPTDGRLPRRFPPSSFIWLGNGGFRHGRNSRLCQERPRHFFTPYSERCCGLYSRSAPTQVPPETLCSFGEARNGGLSECEQLPFALLWSECSLVPSHPAPRAIRAYALGIFQPGRAGSRGFGFLWSAGRNCTAHHETARRGGDAAGR